MAHHEGSRTPHEGTIEFISLDSHKGVGEITQPQYQAAKSSRKDLCCASPAGLWLPLLELVSLFLMLI